MVFIVNNHGAIQWRNVNRDFSILLNMSRNSLMNLLIVVIIIVLKRMIYICRVLEIVLYIRRIILISTMRCADVAIKIVHQLILNAQVQRKLMPGPNTKQLEYV